MSKLKNRTRGFTAVYNDIINDERISLKAKGLYLFLLSKPDNWTFSARLIATQNKDSILSVNTGLQELESFGLLSRSHTQGGYDYEIFDTIKVHSIENRLNGKSTKQKSKIHLMENQSNISNKEPIAKREEERENNYPPSLPEIVDCDLIVGTLSDYPLIEQFIDYVSKGAKYPLSYRSHVREALLRDSDSSHNKTFLSYQEFELSRPDLKQNGVLPTGVNIFDIIGRS